MKCFTWLTVGVLVAIGPTAHAWGPAGHQTVGAITQSLLKGTHAGLKVKQILGTETLATAALWADCAKGVSDTGGFHFVVNPKYPECAPFQSMAGQQAMVDFVQRNWDSCHPAPTDEKCHRQYHYADVAIERSSYARTDVGTSDHDIVSAVSAAITALQGGAVPPPFSITSDKEALRILAHYLGDLHQPLHVGAIYLDATGHEVDPDVGTFDPATKNRGGNLLLHHGNSGKPKNVHAEWDSIASALTAANFKVAGTALAKQVPATTGPIGSWPTQWATQTVLASHTAFAGLTYGTEDPVKHTWPATEPAGYASARAQLQKQQLVRAAAHFAQLLKAIYP